MTARMAAEACRPAGDVGVRLERCLTSRIVRYRLTVDPRLDGPQRAAVIARVEHSPASVRCACPSPPPILGSHARVGLTDRRQER